MILKGKSCGRNQMSTPGVCVGRTPVTYRNLVTGGNNPQVSSRIVFSQLIQASSSRIVIPVTIPYLESNYFDQNYILGNYVNEND